MRGRVSGCGVGRVPAAGIAVVLAVTGALLMGSEAFADGLTPTVLPPVATPTTAVPTSAVPTSAVPVTPATGADVGGGVVDVSGGGSQSTVVSVGGGAATVTVGGAASGGTTGPGGVDAGVRATTGGEGASPAASSPAAAPASPGSGAVPSATPGASAAPGPSAAVASRALSRLGLASSTATVYPVVDGYRDRVQFTLQGRSADGHAVAVRGRAVLLRGTQAVKTWAVRGSSPKLAWDGRVGKVVREGVYRLRVTARSAEGATRSASMRVRVLSHHLEARTATVRSRVDVRAHQATLPAQVRAAHRYGTVTVRIRTVARVSGPARLVFVGNGVTRALRLQDGVQVTRHLIVPKGFEKVRILHRWAKGDVTLRSFQVLWSYSALVR